MDESTDAGPVRVTVVEDEARGMRRADRQNAIAAAVMASGTVRIEDLAERFGVSVMTVHRDLDALVVRGLLRKSRGYATAAATSLFEASTPYRLTQNRELKQALARKAVEFVEPGAALILDDSTTGLYLAELLPDKAPLTVITNFLPVVQSLSGQRDVDLICLGGEYYQWCDAFMGKMTIDAARNLRADLFLMSTSAVIGDVCFHQAQATVLVKSAMFESAQRRILYVDHSKFQRSALHALKPLADFDAVIVDDQTSPDDLDRLRRSGVPVVVAPT